MNPTIVEGRVAGRAVKIETGRLAKQANGSVLITCGETVVLVTAVAEAPSREDIDFFPLTVNYQERFYAAGKIPGGFFKREGRPSNEETLFSRLIDRPLRPLFPDGYRMETQIVATVLSFDGEHEPQLMAMTGASAALGVSGIPFDKVIAGVRVCRVDGQIVVNPGVADREKAELNIIMAAAEDAIVMVEGGARQVPEAVMLEALQRGHEACREAIALQRELFARAPGKERLSFVPPAEDAALRARVESELGGSLDKALRLTAKQERYAAVEAAVSAWKARFKEEMAAAPDAQKLKLAGQYIEDLKSGLVRRRLGKEGTRIDGRDTRTVRPIWSDAGLLPRAHGSSVFTRGETQVLSVVTLGTGEDEQIVDSIRGDFKKAFMLHYNFQPFCVGETGRLGAPGRREIGHGALAERAIEGILPDHDGFPYTIRLVAETLESNGSSSMATVCSGCMALMDAGVPIQAPVAGIAMGLIHEGDRFIILSDILGDEDHLGDMDFKVAGSEKGITAIQMDIKIEGLSMEILRQALEQAREGRLHILREMARTLAAPRADLSPYAPRLETLHINPEKIRIVIGPGGETIRRLIAETGVEAIDIEDDGSVVIASPDLAKLDDAKRRILAMTEEVVVGKDYEGLVKKVVDFGAFVEVIPGTEGLLHISELEHYRVSQVTDVLREGDRVRVRCIDIDDTSGKLRLSRKALLPRPEGAPPDGGGDSGRGHGGDRGGRDRRGPRSRY